MVVRQHINLLSSLPADEVIAAIFINRDAKMQGMHADQDELRCVQSLTTVTSTHPSSGLDNSKWLHAHRSVVSHVKSATTRARYSISKVQKHDQNHICYQNQQFKNNEMSKEKTSTYSKSFSLLMVTVTIIHVTVTKKIK